ncbi:MAG: hypothetical protein JWN21_1019 [Sphingomonas bacterium]|uniref:hypothetical protein n=1 Tax=Sphingomonas bacterium TaxID=1895847 RepID=UPI00262DC066|nr:hypothetical protein [Sphingomonas bacterium]MDB5695476.1 hypothetical protein [Sphingomonas bacterium]
MKFILLAATALLATPALAQTTTMPAPADATMPQTTTTPAPAADMPMAQTTTPMAAPADGTDPVGGYAPTGPAITGTVTPGTPVVFRPAMTPDQAFPAPAPLASYPVCKKGEFDNCMNGPRSTHSHEVRGRRSR